MANAMTDEVKIKNNTSSVSPMGCHLPLKGKAWSSKYLRLR